MQSQLLNFNMVLVGEGFPVSTINLDDFKFRNRDFQQLVRVGPLLQGASKNVSLLVTTDRFQIGVDQPDDLVILAQGVGEVVGTFREYIGRRSVLSVGHNAQAVFTDPGGADDLLGRLGNADLACELVGGPIRDQALVLMSKVGAETTLRLQVLLDEQRRGLLDFNFDFNIASGDVDIETAISTLSESLGHAEQIRDRFAAAASRQEVPQ